MKQPKTGEMSLLPGNEHSASSGSTPLITECGTKVNKNSAAFLQIRAKDAEFRGEHPVRLSSLHDCHPLRRIALQFLRDSAQMIAKAFNSSNFRQVADRLQMGSRNRLHKLLQESI